MIGPPPSSEIPKLRIAVIGSVGVPARYGGFETLVENLAILAPTLAPEMELTIYCSSKAYPDRPPTFHGAALRYVPLKANGVQSIPYDIWSLAWSIRSRADVVLVLGVSGAIAIPIFRLIGSSKFVTNVDGIEWKRAKWRGLSRLFLRLSERLAVRYSDVVIADNDEIASYVQAIYCTCCETIAYGGDHALAPQPDNSILQKLPKGYALSICRIEPENNVRIIVDAFSQKSVVPLVLIGNWAASEYGREVRESFAAFPHLRLLDPIYDLSVLKAIRTNARFYVHGHSAGGTNPSLVEAMHFHDNIVAFDCGFNRATTENAAIFFSGTADLVAIIDALNSNTIGCVNGAMREIANRRYTWRTVADQYFGLFLRIAKSGKGGQE